MPVKSTAKNLGVLEDQPRAGYPIKQLDSYEHSSGAGGGRIHPKLPTSQIVVFLFGRECERKRIEILRLAQSFTGIGVKDGPSLRQVDVADTVHPEIKMNHPSDTVQKLAFRPPELLQITLPDHSLDGRMIEILIQGNVGFNGYLSNLDQVAGGRGEVGPDDKERTQ